MSSKRFFNLFSENSNKTKTSSNSTDKYGDSFETGRRKMSISRSGRFKEHKRRGLITESTFTGLPSDSQASMGPNCNQEQPVSVERNSDMTVTQISVCSAPEIQNEQQESVNDATVAFSENKEEATRIMVAKGKKETLF
jgi:hypothetical protein